MSENIMIADQIIKSFPIASGRITVLGGVSVSIAEKGLTVLKGRSGSGKTTLLNILSGLDTPDSGKVLFKGENLVTLSQDARNRIRRLKMGFVFQSVALMPDMSARENVEYGLRIAGVYGAEARRRAEECLTLVGMDKRMTHDSSALSGGEQQRVAIARAIAHKPEILFADEPTAELDTAMGIQVVDVFKKLIVSEGMSVIMTTHDPNMMQLADKVYNLSDGVITND